MQHEMQHETRDKIRPKSEDDTRPSLPLGRIFLLKYRIPS